MDSKRQLKVSKLLLEELSAVFLKDIQHIFGKAFITITRLQVSPDLGVAKVYLSFLLVADKEATLDLIIENSKVIRNALALRIKKQVRIIPHLVFFLDDSASYAMQMDKIIQDLEIPKENIDKL